MLASVVHVLPLTVIRRERVLPVPGKVLVRQGQKVAPRDTIAETALAPEHLMLNVPQALGVSAAKAKALLQREVGDQVDEGDLIAGPVGLTRRVLRAPVAGKIVLIRKGKILLEVATPPYALRAGMVGVVDDLVADHGAVIQTIGALIQGVWGNGRVDFGLLQNKLESPDGRLSPDQLDVSLRGAIVLGGYCDDPHTLRNGVDIPLKGLILSSMSAALLPLASQIPYPIVVLRGFGFHALDTASYNLITSNQNREASLNAAAFNRFTGARPEVVIPLPAAGDPALPMQTEDYAPGSRVRLARSTVADSIGTIEYMVDRPVILPSGIQAKAAKVVLENEETLMVPLANLELLT